MASINFPNVSFDWLANLPATMEAANTLETRKRTLSDLNAGDADSLIAKGTQLLRAGDTEMGLKLLVEGRQRKSAEERSLLDRATYDWWMKGGPAGLKPGTTGAGVDAGPEVPPDAPGGGGGTPAAPGAVPWPAPGGGTVLPSGTVPSAPGRRSGVVSPTEQVLAAAEGPPPAADTLTRLAQAGGPPPAVSPPSGAPSWLQPGLAAQPMTTQPAGGAPSAPPPGAMRFSPGLNPAQKEAAARADQIRQQLLSLPPGQRVGQYAQTLREDYKRQLDLIAPPKDWKDYYQENFDREAKGEPPYRYSDWKIQQQIAPEEFKTALKIYTGHQDEVRKVNELEPVVNRMGALLNSPDFEAGPGTAGFNKAKALLRNAATLAEKNGVELPEGFKDGINALTNSVQIREAFTSLANSAVFAKLGTLGNQISEGDRGFIEAAFPSLRLTKEGNQLILDYYKELIQRVRDVGKASNDEYRRSRARLNPLDLNEAVDRVTRDTSVIMKDGKLTAFGQRLQDIATSGKPDIAGIVKNGLSAVMPAQERPTQAPMAPGQGVEWKRIYDSQGKPFRLFRDGRVEPEGGQL